MAELIMNTAQDLLKIKIVNSVNTGDRAQDSAIVALCLALMTMLFAFFKKDWKSTLMYHFKYKRANALSKDVYKFYTTKVEDEKYKETLSFTTWFGDDETMNAKMWAYYVKNVSRYVLSTQEAYAFNADNMALNEPLARLKKKLPIKKHTLVYKDTQGEVYLLHIDPEGVFIAYTTKSTLDAFTSQVEKLDVKPSKNTSALEIHDVAKGLHIGKIYADRTFDSWISRYKVELLEALENFVVSNSKISGFNGYGSYNLGILVYGEPGTGKTMLIKAIANKLRRNVGILNVSKIKTASELISHLKLTNYVLCLDEFDFLKDILVSRDESPNSEEVKDEVKSRTDELNSRKHDLLKLTTSEKSTNIEKEIDKIDRELDELKNRITLESFLTALDGVVEVRNRIIIATTNYIDRIDSALIREGRFDLKINLGKFNETETRDMLKYMFGNNLTSDELTMLNETKLISNVYTPVQIIHICKSAKTFQNSLKALTQCN